MSNIYNAEDMGSQFDNISLAGTGQLRNKL
jgi:hypothetical protein